MFLRFKTTSDYIQIKKMCKDKGKGRAIPVKAWTVPEGFRRLRLPDFKTIDT
jgi:hypothetical protein